MQQTRGSDVWTAHSVVGLGIELACAVVLYQHFASLPQVAVDALFMFYQPLICMTAMIWLWSLIVLYFESSAVRYEACFVADHHRYLLQAKDIRQIAWVFTVMVSISMAVFARACALGHVAMASYQPGLLYLSVVAVLVNPADVLFKENRMFFLDTARRVFLPFQVVHFSDFLLADILTSLAKPLSDLGLACCHLFSSRSLAQSLVHGFGNGSCSSHALQIPLLLALPYFLRFVQCIIVYRTTGDTNQLFNALKYTTAFPVVALSFVKYRVPLTLWRSFYKPMWVVAAVVNTGYSFFWDVERDWDMKLFTAASRSGWLKQDVRLSPDDAPYLWLIGSNLLLRISWTYKLSSHLRHLHGFVLAVTLLEIYRRFQWAFVRLENELRKVQHKSPDLIPLVPNAPKRKSSAMALTDREVPLAGL